MSRKTQVKPPIDRTTTNEKMSDPLHSEINIKPESTSMEHNEEEYSETERKQEQISMEHNEEEHNEIENKQESISMKYNEEKQSEIENNSVKIQVQGGHLRQINDEGNQDEFGEFGQIKLKIKENRHCRKSKFTGYHIQRRNGIMDIALTIDEYSIDLQETRLLGDTNTHKYGILGSINTIDSFYNGTQVRCTLVRSNPTYTHFPIETVCALHRHELQDQKMTPHMLQAVTDQNNIHKYETGFRNSVLFPIKRTEGKMTARMILHFICSDSCRTNENRTFRAKESSRDLWLVVAVEHPQMKLVLGRQLIQVWPKAVVRENDLKKLVRRQPKGGAAQEVARRRWQNMTQDYNETITELDKMEDELVNHAMKYKIPFTLVRSRLKEKFDDKEKILLHNREDKMTKKKLADEQKKEAKSTKEKITGEDKKEAKMTDTVNSLEKGGFSVNQGKYITQQQH